MKKLLSILCLIGVVECRAELLTPAWVELDDKGASIARVIVSDTGSCPTLNLDGVSQPMTLRAPVPPGFRPLCEAQIAGTATKASVGTQQLALPKTTLSKVLVFGDTGCRIKGARIQDCNDPTVWPFKKVAIQAAAELPDLVIHVGDYLYREDMCPQTAEAKCGGTPNGDNWETWDADFFEPAAKLLAAAPWAFARGNHEDCKRAWRGWFYYLDPRPWTGESCEEMTPPYKAGAVEPAIVMFDSSSVSEDAQDASRVKFLTKQFASVHVTHGWLVAHHAPWGVRPDKQGRPIPVSTELQSSWNSGSPQGIDLILSGHTHLFELLNFVDQPVQLVAGIGGTQLSAPLPQHLDGLHTGNATILAGKSNVEFGYTLLTRGSGGWNLTLKNHQNNILAVCTLQNRRAECGSTAAADTAR